MAIKEGTVTNVNCPSVQCTQTRVKRQKDVAKELESQGGEDVDGANVNPQLDQGEVMGRETVEGVVGSELADRYFWLVEKRAMENSMPSVAQFIAESS